PLHGLLTWALKSVNFPFLLWRHSPTRRCCPRIRRTHCGNLSSPSGRLLFSTVCFCADILPSSLGATLKCRPTCLPNGIETRCGSQSCAFCSNGSLNTGSMYWRFSIRLSASTREHSDY